MATSPLSPPTETTTTKPTSGDDRYDQLCKQLDELTFAYIHKMNQYVNDRATTNSELQKGFLELAHAKYTMGDKTLSHASYDGRMKAKLLLKVDHKDNSTPYTMIRLPKERIDLGLRQRIENETEWMQKKDLKDVVDKEEYEMDEKKPGKKVRRIATKANGDPLHWFGLLVSPSLRTCQDYFQTATTHLIDTANLIHELRTMEQRYLSLEQEKNAIDTKRYS
ncbi:hypothetical protein BC941DRAFT_430855 [Chlamydoabsidia padenii]|nr:hypothetical protein BC941DRAFT_430855 [Chlamydoabsidia padenii]